jgi:transcriptional regulator with XRE-family HTH domain
MQVAITKQILELIRAYANKEGISLSQFAKRTDISKAWLSKLKNHDANLSLETATYLLNEIGYDLQVKKRGKEASYEIIPFNKYASISKEHISKELISKELISNNNESRLKKVIKCQKDRKDI